MTDCDVLVCGLGPVGQLLALLLGDLGVSAIAVDEADEPYDLPRAAVIDDEVLRIFQSIGLDEQVLSEAQVQDGVSFVTNRGRAIRVLETTESALGQPPLVSIHQPSLERSMVAALESRGAVDLRWGQRVETIDRAAEQVTAWIRPRRGGRAEPISARYVVACDGGRSAVRSRLRVQFGGSTFTQHWLVVDTRIDRPLRAALHPHFVGNADRPIVSLPMSPGRHRWEWMLLPGEAPDRLLKPEQIDALLERWIADEKVEVERAVVYAFHARTAERWRAGRVFLAGDAAHVMPPFVGQGFSSGARDVANLAWKLDAVLNGAPENLLDSYEEERRPHVTSMQKLAVRWGGVVQTTNPAVAKLRDSALEGLDRIGVLRRVSGIAKPLPTYRAGAFVRRPHPLPPLRTVGAMFPQPGRLDDRLGQGWSVVASTSEASEAWRNEGIHTVELPHEREWSLLRPDRFVFAQGDMPGALEALRRTVGRGVRTEGVLVR